MLPEDEAFRVTAYVNDAGLLKVNWIIADDYYMYRDQFAIESTNPSIRIDMLDFPEGQVEDDPEFGEVVVYFYNTELTSNLVSIGNTADNLDLVLKGQGCNKPVGVCYPPMSRPINISLDSLSLEEATAPNSPASNNKSFAAYILSALFAGLLLSFTPCVLPMIPILAGVIAGQKQPSKLRSGFLAICYVAGTIVTYVFAGALAGATGAQLQSYFQNAWVISAICSLLVLLAGSLFGWFTIQMPSSIQNKLNSAESSGKSAAWSSFLLGLISALVVGACVSPILIVTLGAAITQGDPVLGAAIMGSMALGMGVLLIAFGFGAGWILPKAGPWMNHIQIIFGFMVLGVAIYLLNAIPAVPVLLLWAPLFLVSGFYLWSVASELKRGLGQSAIRAASAIVLIWGVLALLGGALNGKDIFNPLEPLLSVDRSSIESIDERSKLPFKRTSTLSEAQSWLAQAKLSGQPALVDFYADWCLDCRRMHRTTFTKESVKNALSNWALIEIDVTDTSQDTEEAKKFFNVFGPPATLFFAKSGEENLTLRQYGYLNENTFLNLVSKTTE